MILTREQLTVAHAILAYQYNTSDLEYVADVYGDVHPSYAAEKAALWGQSTTRAIGALDEIHFSRLVEAAWNRHGAEGSHRAMLVAQCGGAA